MGLIHEIDGTQGKEFGFANFLVAVLHVGKNQQQSIAATFDSQTDTLKRFGQGPAFRTI
jgi:hypothetical protein